MGTVVEAIDDAIGAFIGAQQMFFVATARLAKGAAVLRTYQTQKNGRTIDGLPAVDWLEAERS
jgi:hypothetical protein